MRYLIHFLNLYSLVVGSCSRWFHPCNVFYLAEPLLHMVLSPPLHTHIQHAWETIKMLRSNTSYNWQIIPSSWWSAMIKLTCHLFPLISKNSSHLCKRNSRVGFLYGCVWMATFGFGFGFGFRYPKYGYFLPIFIMFFK